MFTISYNDTYYDDPYDYYIYDVFEHVCLIGLPSETGFFPMGLPKHYSIEVQHDKLLIRNNQRIILDPLKLKLIEYNRLERSPSNLLNNLPFGEPLTDEEFEMLSQYKLEDCEGILSYYNLTDMKRYRHDMEKIKTFKKSKK